MQITCSELGDLPTACGLLGSVSDQQCTITCSEEGIHEALPGLTVRHDAYQVTIVREGFLLMG